MKCEILFSEDVYLVVNESFIHETRHEDDEVKLHCDSIEKILIPFFDELNKTPEYLENIFMRRGEVESACKSVEFAEEPV